MGFDTSYILNKKIPVEERDKYNQIITKRIDLFGKTKGQTWDVPHVGKYRLGGSPFQDPFTFVDEFGPVSYGATANINDGSLANITTSSNNAYSQHIFSYDVLTEVRRTAGLSYDTSVSELRSLLRNIVANTNSFAFGVNAGVQTYGTTMKVWNKTTLSWVDVGSNTSTSASLITANLTNFNDYIDNNGFIHILVHSTYPSNGTIASNLSTDYPCLEFTVLGKFLNVKPVESIDKENPFQTAYGQEVVSVEESFWARLGRLGRWRWVGADGTGTSSNLTSGSLNYVKTLDVAKGNMFYPKSITLSSNVDALLVVKIDTKVAFIGGGVDAWDGIIFYRTYAKAYQPVTFNFDGEIFADELGQIAIGINPTAAANLVCTVYGVEVAK